MVQGSVINLVWHSPASDALKIIELYEVTKRWDKRTSWTKDDFEIQISKIPIFEIW